MNSILKSNPPLSVLIRKHQVNNIIILVIIFLIINANYTPLRAQQDELRFNHLTIDDGLSNNTVSCILQDSKGFIWIGTHNGLSKYDGYEINVFNKDDNTLGSLSGDIIKCIYEDSKNNLWIGTSNNGLNLYDRSSNRFYSFSHDSLPETPLIRNGINSIIEDKQGILLIGTDNGIDLFEPHSKRFTNYLPYDPVNYPDNYNSINVVYEDSDQNLWLGTGRGGLCLFDRANKTFEKYLYDPKDNNSIGDNDIRSIHEDTEGNLWIGTYTGGLNLLNKNENKFNRFYPNPDVKESFTIKAILDDQRGNLWIGTRDGLYLFNKKTHRFIRYAHDPHNQSSLNHNNVQVISKDTKGDFWFGTKGGINFLNITSIPFVHYRADVNNRKYLNQKVVWAIIEDHNGELWFGTEEGGLNRLNRQSGKFTYYLHDPDNPNTVSSNNINSIVEDRENNIWIGTYQGGLNQFNRKTNRFKSFKIDPDKSLINQSSVQSLFIDRDGDLWIGASNLFRFNKKKNSISPIPLNMTGLYPSIHTITQDSTGNIWCGSQDGKIYCINKKPLTSEFYHIYVGNEISRINTITVDKENNLWIGSRGGGLFFFDPINKTHLNYTIDDGLASNWVTGILEDGKGKLWISTTKGLSKFDPDTKVFKNFYKENGLQGNLFSRAYCKTRTGEMFFGGANGVTAFHPDRIISNSYIPPIVITDFKIFNKSVEIGGNNSILTRDISETKNIDLSYKDAVFTFTFSALNFAISQQNKFAYLMEGFETDWNYVDSRKRFATYTNLDPGRYTFRVKAANNDGLWNEEGTSIIINISPPFWQSWWFKIIIIVLISLIIMHLIRYQRQKRNLLKATALANLSQLKLLRNQMNPHFLFNALGSIRSLIHIDKDKAWQLVSELAEFFQYTLLNYNKAEATLDEEIEAANNYLNIEKIQYEEPLKVSFEVDDAARKCIVPAFILQPLMENAIKHGLNENPEIFEIKIKIALDQENLSIDIANTGNLPGVSSDSSKVSDPHGTSLKNIRERLNILFNDDFTLQLIEEEGWVHARIEIRYSNSDDVISRDIGELDVLYPDAK